MTPTTSLNPAPPISAAGPSGSTGLTAIVRRGRDFGAELHPHVSDGCHIVSSSRYEKDYVRVPVGQLLEPYLARGLRLRMSRPGRAPSLIRPDAIRGRPIEA